ncbi:MAG: hypothetical protein CL840_08160 [Crocinitomicaceae bacterium]|nr:hypothetical protein [Crocinitomicaceae bacterium]|tara:strand:+ start:40414 stop:43902 length:3489 start_codon:yes stop_codon:yes gene_type:complete
MRDSICAFLILGFSLVSFEIVGQESQGPDRPPIYKSTGDTLKIDSLSLVPGTVKLYTVDGILIDSNHYSVNSLKGELIWSKNSPYKNQEVQIEYKSFPFNFYQEYHHKDAGRVQNKILQSRNPFKYTAVPTDKEDIFELGGIEKSGSISRGLGFGNNRDLSVSSSMNLQLNGKIADNLYVMAAISDESIPIQAEGNTQQLQDFDKVFIQIYNNRSKLIAGDYMIKSRNSYFMKYLKKAQGISGSSTFYLGKNKMDTAKAAKMKVQLSGALSRGKFSRNIIQGVEGNQGPYRLRGEENESYIIILSGTERVYIDGKLLTRGQDQDYTINYNTAEISFTAKQIVTKDKRIIIEFQYSDQNYTRSVVQFSDFYEYKKLKLNFNLYSEQDAKNQSLQQDLSEEQKDILAGVGDSLDQAISNGARLVEYNENEVLYKIVDTLGHDSVFVYSTNPDSAFYRVTFSEVGQGNGDYVLLNTVANGRVYQWVQPSLGGIKQGNFAPVVLLFSPKQRQMISFGGNYDFNKSSALTFEGAVSNNDINTFSDKDKDDDIGYSGKINWDRKIALNTNGNWSLTPQIGYEHWSKYFTEIERVRTVEFYRDWNLRDVDLTDDQNLTKAALKLTNGKKGALGYRWNGFYSGGEYNANKHELLADWKYKGLLVDFDGYYLNSKGSLSNTEFIRHKSLIQQRIFFFNLGYRDDREDNKINDQLGDTLSAAAYRFWEREFFLKSTDSAALQYKVFYNQRDDEKSRNNEIVPVTFGESVGLSFDWRKNKVIQLASKTTYRTLSIKDTSLTTQKPDENLLSRVEYTLRVLKGAITASSFYEIGSGLEAGREFQFIEVPAGQGEYTWIDYNENGIKEINEFEIGVYDDQKKYIKISILTDDYVKAFTHQFNQTVLISPGRVWRKKKGIKKFISAFSNQFSYRINRKTQNDNADARFNPLPSAGLDSSLLTLSSSLRNTVYFNRTHPVYGIDWTYQDIKGRVFLTNGFESRSNVFQNTRLRVNIGRLFLTEVDGKLGRKFSQADYASSRDFNIQYYSIQPKITFQKGVSFRVAVLYQYQEKKNDSEKGELGQMHKLGVETKLNKVGKGSFVAEANVINLSYNEPSNSSLSYEMLDGLLPGINGTWQLSYQRNIGKYLQLDLSYGGRQSEDAKTIHTGSMRVRAYF